MKFKYNYQNNTLAYQTEPESETWLELGEEQQFVGNFNSQGFELANGWIDFQVYAKQIKAFAKLTTSPFWPLDPSDIFTAQTITYYRKYLAKDCPVIFEFSEKDAVEKIGGKWIYTGKGGQRE